MTTDYYESFYDMKIRTIKSKIEVKYHLVDEIVFYYFNI